MASTTSRRRRQLWIGTHKKGPASIIEPSGLLPLTDWLQRNPASLGSRYDDWREFTHHHKQLHILTTKPDLTDYPSTAYQVHTDRSSLSFSRCCRFEPLSRSRRTPTRRWLAFCARPIQQTTPMITTSQRWSLPSPSSRLAR